MRIAPAAATGELHRQEIAALQSQAGDLRRERALAFAAWIEHRLRRMCRLGAEHPVRGELEAVHAQVDARFVRQDPPLPAHAKAAAEGAGSAGIGGELVALDPHRELALDRLD